MHRVLSLAIAALVTACSALPGAATPTPQPVGILVITADAQALDDVSDSMPAYLGLRIAAGRSLSSNDVVVALDGHDLASSAAADGSVSVRVNPLLLGSAHHLVINVATLPVFDDTIHVIGTTDVMAAEHHDPGGVALDIVFSNPPVRAAVTALISAPTEQWSDDTHLHLLWPTGAPQALHLPASLPVQHGSQMAGALNLQLLPVPPDGAVRRVVVPAAEPVTGTPINAYAVGTAASRHSLLQHAGSLASVSPTGWATDAAGNLSGTPDPVDVVQAQRAGLTIEPLVAASPDVLTSDSGRATLTTNVTSAVVAGGFAGIHLDAENIAAADRDHFTALVQALAHTLHAAGRHLEVDVVPHKPAHQTVYSAGYDVPAIAAVADHIVFMAYDEHTQATIAGPVAGLDWINTLIDGTLADVPASKVLLGLSVYARTWSTTGSSPDSYASALATALTTAGATVDYDFAAATPFVHFTPADGSGPSLCYFDDADSLARKLALVGRHGYAGATIWRLGFEDPAFWGVL